MERETGMPKLKVGESKAEIQQALNDAREEIARLNALLEQKESERVGEAVALNAQLAAARRETVAVQQRLNLANNALESSNEQLRALRAKSLQELLAWGFSRQVLEPGLQDDARGVFELLAKAYAGRRNSSFSTGVEQGDKATGKVESGALARKMQLTLALGSKTFTLTFEEAPRYEPLKYERMYGLRNETDWLSNSKPKELVGDLPSRSEIAAFMPATTMIVHGTSLGRFMLYRGRPVLFKSMEGVPPAVAELVKQLFAELDKEVKA